jgi:hypothetical protein
MGVEHAGACGLLPMCNWNWSSCACRVSGLRKSRTLAIETGGRRYRQQDRTFRSIVLIRGILIDGLGHAWSGGDARYMFSDPAGPDASRLILEFLLSHQLPADISAGAGGQPTGRNQQLIAGR